MSARRALALALGLAGLAPSAAAGDEPLTRAAYRIEAVLDTARHAVDGRQTVELLNRSGAPLARVYLHLHANAFSGKGTAFARDRRTLAFFQDPSAAVPAADETGSIRVYALRAGGAPAPFTVDGTLMEVALPEPLPHGAATRLELGFELLLPRFRDRLGYRESSYALAAWYPKLAVLTAAGWDTTQYRGIGEFFAETADYEVALTVPRGFVLGATGERIGSEDGPAGTVTTRWCAEGVRDFAWAADPRFRAKEGSWNGVAIRYLHLPGHEAAAEAGVRVAAEALRYFSERYAPYPYSTFTVVESPAIADGRGIEYPSLVMLSEDLHRGEAVADAHEEVLVHEVAHQWWYGLVGNDERREAWLDEAFATHSARRFMREERGGESPAYRWPGRLSFLPAPTRSDIGRYLYTAQAELGFDRPVHLPAADYRESQSYRVAVYEKGSFVLDMLEYLIGDEPFERLMRAHAARFGGGVATSADFRRLAERESGRSLERFFAQWVEGTGVCDYAVERISPLPSAPGTHRAAVRVRRLGPVVMPVVLRLHLRGGGVVERRLDGEAEVAEVEVTTGARVASAELDPERRLLETDRANNHFPRRRHLTLNPLDAPADAYSIAPLPYLWYEDGLEVGALVAAGYSPRTLFPTGLERPRGLLLQARTNLATGRSRVSASYSDALEPLGPRAFWDLSAAARPGRRTGELAARWIGGEHLYRSPYHAVRLAIVLDDWQPGAESERPGEPFDPGRIRSLRGEYRYNHLLTDHHPRSGALWEAGVEAAAGVLGSGYGFLRVHGRAELYRPVGDRGRLALHLFHGAVRGDAPSQRGLLLSREGGLLSPRFRSVHGTQLSAVNAELRRTLSGGALPLAAAAFASGGRYWGEAGGETAVEAGVGLRLFDNAPYAVQLDLPLWARGPAGTPGDSPRLVLRFGRPFGAALP